MDKAQKTRVWDLPTRLFHWCLAICVVGAWLSHEAGLNGFVWHTYFGYSIMVLVLWRVGWGALGSRYARFASFLRGPRVTWRYLVALRKGEPGSSPGHNPAGGWAIVAMLGVLTAQASTGLANGGELLMEGPWFHSLSEGMRDLAREVHEVNFNLLLGLIGLHLGAIVFYRVKYGKRLVGAMITGKKKTQAGSEDMGASRPWLALGLLALAITLVWGVVSLAPPPAADSLNMF